MLKQTRENGPRVFVELGKLPKPGTPEDLPMRVVVPAFAISELKTGFQMGFFLFVPFLLIDLVVSTTLLSMGMMQLPPAMISLPFKVLLFVMIDGWNLIVASLVRSFRKIPPDARVSEALVVGIVRQAIETGHHGQRADAARRTDRGCAGQRVPDGDVDPGQRARVHPARRRDLHHVRADLPLDAAPGGRIRAAADSAPAGARAVTELTPVARIGLLLLRPGDADDRGAGVRIGVRAGAGADRHAVAAGVDARAVDGAARDDQSAAALAVIAMREVVIGLAIALSLRIVIAGAELAGHLAGFSLGFSYASAGRSVERRAQQHADALSTR